MKHLCHHEISNTENGFTIVELLIATTIFSMVIIVILYGVLSFTHAYYSGVNNTTTQGTARTVLNTIAQSIEFSGNSIVTTPVSLPAPGNPVAFCAGDATYIYDWGTAYSSAAPLSSTNAGLYVAPGSCNTTAPYPIPIPNGRELLSDNMRITYLTVSQSTAGSRLYTISLGLAYGDKDLLCNASRNGSGSGGGCLRGDALNTQDIVVGNSAYVGGPENDVECRQTTGWQFCAHAGLSTTVSLRVAGGALN
jgi:type II secretory pathway pseudopilin PulG